MFIIETFIGKNNKRFDDKHVNTMRLIHGLDGRPDLLDKVDDLESQLRKYFAFPTTKLDYISDLLGLGGKHDMCFQDWIDIVEKTKNGKKKFNKMINYCGKDVSDTKAIWKYCEKHFKPKYNYSAATEREVCVTCGSSNIKKNGTRLSGGVMYQQYFCNEHGGYAGKASLKQVNNKRNVKLRS